MKFMAAIFCAGVALASAGAAQAGQAEVRDVALNNGCSPKKIEIVKQSMGGAGTTSYRVQCVIPKTIGTTGNDSKPPDALLINCEQTLCYALHPVSTDTK